MNNTTNLIIRAVDPTSKDTPLKENYCCQRFLNPYTDKKIIDGNNLSFKEVLEEIMDNKKL